MISAQTLLCLILLSVTTMTESATDVTPTDGPFIARITVLDDMARQYLNQTFTTVHALAKSVAQVPVLGPVARLLAQVFQNMVTRLEDGKEAVEISIGYTIDGIMSSNNNPLSRLLGGIVKAFAPAGNSSA